MNVYIDELFLINTFTNFLLLTVAAKASGENLRLRRAVCAAGCGGIYAVITVYPEFKACANFICRFIFSLFMLYLAFGKRRNFIKIFIGFYVAVFIFAGTTVVFMNMGMQAVIYNGNLYFDFPLGGFILLTVVLTYATNKITAYFKSLLMRKGIRCDISIKYNGKSIFTEGIFDTGNFLCDPISRKAVAVADIHIIDKLYDEKFADAVIRNDYLTALSLERCRLIPYSTVGHKNDFLIASEPDVFKVNGKEVRILLGITNSGGSIIINPKITETGVVVK